ncbi:hypothetical protein QAD02_010594 [Eretmocerus hayati]|uniref:Uncharacterized protein n=1 Tax=Eretmocerus hayati TaxID=131215 RepID=A0ACC2NVB0_9HYME|nr:hypothetical protein QAD02_010594 [Eretmocerus hayati]
MSALIICYDSNIMMLEVAVDKLIVPQLSPFDSVILSKYFVSFRFLDDDWIEVTPNRKDYRDYKGSGGSEQRFRGGKSVTFSLPKSALQCESEGLALQIVVRREISKYFERDDHCVELGCVFINVDNLFNGIVHELKMREELDCYLEYAHERDPISRSLKGCFALYDTCTNERTSVYLSLYARLSHLGGCVLTEIEPMWKRRCGQEDTGPIYFYAQEQTNLSEPYECLELVQRPIQPKSDLALASKVRAAMLKCCCTPDQQHALLIDWCKKTCAIGTDPCADGDMDGKKKKRKGKKKSDKGTGTGDLTGDKGVGTGDRKKRPSLTDSELARLLAKKKGAGGGGAGVFIEKTQPCEPCEPCPPCPPCIPCDPCPIEVCFPPPSCPLPIIRCD